MDDSESLEYRAPSGGEDPGVLLAGVTCYDRPQTPLLIHVPGEIESTLLIKIIHHALDWFAKNMPGTIIDHEG
jgi:hypothetical protein